MEGVHNTSLNQEDQADGKQKNTPTLENAHYKSDLGQISWRIGLFIHPIVLFIYNTCWAG